MTDRSLKTNACLACRSRHLKCDGQRPACVRCEAQNSSCLYVASLRGQIGGRRKRPDALTIGPARSAIAATSAAMAADALTETLLPTSREADGMVLSRLGQVSPSGLPAPDQCMFTMESSVVTYYRTVHRSHPFLIPYREYLQDRCSLPTYLKHCMVFAAGPFTSIDQEAAQMRALEILDPCLPDDFPRVQALLLLTIISHARAERQIGNQALEQAIRIAATIGLGSESFAIDMTPVHRESHRRTWWQLFITATMVSLVTGLDFPVEVDVSRTLPCEDTQYEDCAVVPSGTLQDMQDRNLSEYDCSWSSLAYLVESSQVLRKVLQRRANLLAGRLENCVESLEASLTMFNLSLPPEKQHSFGTNGQTDEVMAMAHMLVNIAGICLHLPLSGIGLLGSFVPICGNDTGSQQGSKYSTQLYHSIKAIKCAQALTRVIIGKEDLDTLTPCLSCGLAFSTNTLLNALLIQSEHFSKDNIKELIKLSLTALKRIGKAWPIASMVRSQLATYYRDMISEQAHSRAQEKSTTGFVARTTKSDLNAEHSILLEHAEHGLDLEEILGLEIDCVTNAT